ncbi:MAG: hypothetical protein BMS9Abin29_2468 [Gemmatimonadota bacterium]|nr:MAG: hypothetical protein BMS9Abin29_2468 [Gemmatimonadota bacterium]
MGALYHRECRSAAPSRFVSPWPRPTRLVPTAAAWALLSVALLNGAASQAQEVSGPILPGGTLRLDLRPAFTFWDTRFGERTENGILIEEEEPLGFDFSDAAAGTRLFPTLQRLQNALDSAIPGGTSPIRFGRTDVLVTRSEVRVPIRLDFGVTDWLSVGVMVPLTKRRSEVAFGVTADSANIGLSPIGSAPAQVNDFLNRLGNAVASLTQVTNEICQTQGSGSAACLGAQTLLNSGSLFQSAITDAYGVRSGGFPLTGSSLGDALLQRVAALGQAFTDLGVGGFPTAVPLSTLPFTTETFLELISDARFGVEGDPFGLFQSPWELGDIEVFGHARLLEGSSAAGRTNPASGIHYEVGAGALVRLGTGTPDMDQNFLDLGSGEGHTDLEVQGFAGARFGTRLGAWLDVRYGIQGTTELFRRAEAPDRGFAALTTRTPVRWTPGNYFQVRLTPRFQITDAVSLALDFRHYSKARDTFERLEVADSLNIQVGGDPALLELETEQSVREFGVGIVYSTLAARRAGKTEKAAEFSLLFRAARSGSGGLTPKTSMVQVGFRLFRSFWD